MTNGFFPVHFSFFYFARPSNPDVFGFPGQGLVVPIPDTIGRAALPPDVSRWQYRKMAIASNSAGLLKKE
jgi:hypothetical protein